MHNILLIDTSGTLAMVGIWQNDHLLDAIYNADPFQHSTFLHPAIALLLKQNSLTGADLSAIAVSNGPGSYTGLRVALSSAKGLCFIWQKPLITISTLEIMANAMVKAIEVHENEPISYIIPQIDARRQEVYHAIYRFSNVELVIPPCSYVLNEDAYAAYLNEGIVFFAGSGMNKWRNVTQHPNAQFIELVGTEKAFGSLANAAFKAESFADVASAEPLYGKPFFSTAKMG